MTFEVDIHGVLFRGRTAFVTRSALAKMTGIAGFAAWYHQEVPFDLLEGELTAIAENLTRRGDLENGIAVIRPSHVRSGF